MNNLVLTFPKNQCDDIVIKGSPFVQVDVGMDANSFILNLLKWIESEDPIGAVVRRGQNE